MEELEGWENGQKGDHVTARKREPVQTNSKLRTASSWPDSEEAEADGNLALKPVAENKKTVLKLCDNATLLVKVPLYLYQTDDYNILIPRVSIFDILFTQNFFFYIKFGF